MRMHSIPGLAIAATTASLLAGGCSLFDEAKDKLDLDSEVSGRITDNRGEPVAGARLRLFDLRENQDFVEGGDLAAAAAYIDREAVLGSTNSIASAESNADGELRIDGVAPGAFLASVVKDGCTAGFAGFDAETGELTLDTLLVPDFANGLSFEIPTFVVACATPPEVGPDGNSDEAPPFEPQVPDVVCDASTCTAAGGTCSGDTCTITCAAASCAESGGTCVDGACALPLCNASACEAAGGACDGDRCAMPTCDAAACEGARGTCSADATSCDIPACWAGEADCTATGGTCSADGSVCDLPACSADAECDAAQPGAYCTDPGDVVLAACNAPLAAEIIPPDEALGWTSLRLADASGTVLVDASADNQALPAASIPADGIVRLTAELDGDATSAYLQVQSGGQACPNLPPRTDFIPIEIVDGAIAGQDGPFVELALHGGYQKLQVTTSPVLGEGDGSFAIAIGEPCAPPAFPLVATLTWEAGPGQPADLDLSVWNGAGELVFVGDKQAAWGQLALDAKAPGPEVFVAEDASQGPFTVKVEFFSGKPRDLEAKLRVQRIDGGQLIDDTFTFVVTKPKDIAEIGVFTATP
ncbi:MAG TPA: carboxypeptidase-like regulatory domain-containing protein [Nannocystaceae bacterium]|nr:carboxypeptidase-like regulatory domain-containing protein [Nannocystaceae bacterium]